MLASVFRRLIKLRVASCYGTRERLSAGSIVFLISLLPVVYGSFLPGTETYRTLDV